MKVFMIFDARAMHSIDDAICLSIEHTLDEAKEMQKHYGACVIAKSEDKDNSPIEIMPETFYKGEEDGR